MKINLTKEQMLYAEDIGKKRHEIDINLNAKGEFSESTRQMPLI